MRTLLIFLICVLTFSCKNNPKSKVQLKVIAIAKNEWKNEFSYDDFELSKLDIVIFKSGKNFIVKGRLPDDREGGVPVALIDTSNFEIVEVYHTK